MAALESRPATGRGRPGAGTVRSSSSARRERRSASSAASSPTRRRRRSAASRSGPAMERAGLPEGTPVDEVLMGQVLQAGVGQAPARQAALAAGLAGHDVARRRSTASADPGLKSIMLAAAEIRAGDAELVVAGGMENMNLAPYFLPKAPVRAIGSATRTLVDCDGRRRPVVRDRGLPHGHPRRAGRDPATTSAARTRTRSRSRRHQRAIAARTRAGSTPSWRRSRSATRRAARRSSTTDEGPRRDSTLEALARLKPVFDLPTGEDRGDATIGTVTAGNAPGHHRRRRRDGRRQRARRRAARPEAARPDRRLRPGRGRAEVAVPRARSTGRPPAARPDRAADRGVRPDRDQRGVRRPDPRRRPRARVRLGQGQRQRRRDRARPSDRAPAARGSSRRSLHELRRREGRYGLATLCLGGGGSVAMAVERVAG